MKFICLILSPLFFLTQARAQFYYKDQILIKQSRDQLQQYKVEKVRSVKLKSFEADGKPTEDFVGEQSVNNNYTQLITYTKTALSDTSELKTFFNAAGQVIKTIDTADGFSSVTEYTYETNNRITVITNISTSAGQAKEKEQHLWYYNDLGKPTKMLKIKNDIDTTLIEFTLDEKGNVSEERSTRKKKPLGILYYYYDERNRLTDIVRYNPKAQRLLPDYMFEYDEEGRLSTMLVVPEGSSDYQKWFFSYYENGLKGQEAAYNKKQELLGKVEYHYSFLN